LPVERPTFNESWYRVADLRPRLRSTAQTVRQHYRGQLWYIVQDPANNQYFRLSREGYVFMGLLDGRRSVAQAWELANEELGDGAPTQGEAIQLLGQLHAGNLLQADLPPDAENLFDRYKKRVQREVGSYLLNFMFSRMPLLNPDRFLDRWVGVTGWIFSWVGLLVWAVLVGTGFYFVAARWPEFWKQSQAQELLKTDNLLYLYVGFALIKAIHEFGHAFACKHFGRLQHMGGRVHAMGIMLLVFMPCPYVDASSAWVLRNKWHRMIIGAAGMYVELAVAGIAAVVWSLTGDSNGAGATVHAIAHNMVFVASVSTLLFNANPLLRYDGYYILADYLEIPNLAQRSKDYLYFLVRRYIFGVERIHPQPQTTAEKRWLVIYGLASGVYRIVVSVTIMFYVADKLFIVGALMALGGIVGWVLVPLGKFIRYLATSPELLRVRGRAVGATLAFAALVAIVVGAIPITEHDRAEGLAKAANTREVYAGAEGFVQYVLPTGSTVLPARASHVSDGTILMEARNTELEARLAQAEARYGLARTELNAALTQEPSAVQALQGELRAWELTRDSLKAEIGRLTVRAPMSGQWACWDAEELRGSYVHRAQHLGTIADLSGLVVRVSADQTLGPRLEHELGINAKVVLRVADRPEDRLTGTITKIFRSGQHDLASPALGLQAGGSLQVRPDDRTDQDRSGRSTDPHDPARGVRPVEPFFEIEIAPDSTLDAAHLLHPGQRVIARFSLPPKPLALQAWHSLQQLLQRRFKM
jgi:putative peptide zinc metalloprotease protein